MPISSDDTTGLNKAILAIYTDAEETLLGIIARRVAQGITEPGWADRLLVQIQLLRGDVAALLAVLEEQGLIAYEQMVAMSYNRGVAVAGSDLTAAGAAAGAFGVVDQDAVRALAREGRSMTASITDQITRVVPSIFREVTQQVVGQQIVGALTRREAAAKAMAKFAASGITGFTDKAGRNWDLASYTEMATRTASANAAVTGHANRLTELGHDLVMVSTAPETCPICAPFEGRVLSLTGRTAAGRQTKNGQTFTVVCSLADARSRGLHHPNCRHREGIFLPGFTDIPEHPGHDAEAYALRQRERAMERAVRAHKRRVQVQQEIGTARDVRAARADLRASQARLKSFREENNRTQGKNANRTSLTAR